MEDQEDPVVLAFGDGLLAGRVWGGLECHLAGQGLEKRQNGRISQQAGRRPDSGFYY